MLPSWGNPCIFVKSPETAAERLHEAITEKLGGFDEGTGQWLAIIKAMLTTDFNLKALSLPGATFTEKEWR